MVLRNNNIQNIKKEKLRITYSSTEVKKFFHNSRNFKIIKGYNNG